VEQPREPEKTAPNLEGDDALASSESAFDPDAVRIRPKPDAGPVFELEPAVEAPKVKAPSPIAVQEANAKIAEAERREAEERERKKREEESLDGKPLTEPLVPREFRQWRTVAYIGAGVLALAAGLAWHGAAKSGFIVALIVMYTTVLHSGLALGALRLQAMLEQRPMGEWREALARFFLSLAVFHAVLYLPLKTGYVALDKSVLAVAAAGAFVGAVIVLFRWPPRRAVMVGGIQVLIWVALTMHVWLEKLIRVK
jgi:hypothetical protein